jgi:hypothetical protein
VPRTDLNQRDMLWEINAFAINISLNVLNDY